MSKYISLKKLMHEEGLAHRILLQNLQAFDSRLFALGGAQSHRFVPVKVADSHQTSFHQQQQQNVVQKQARPPLPPTPHFPPGTAALPCPFFFLPAFFPCHLSRLCKEQSMMAFACALRAHNISSTSLHLLYSLVSTVTKTPLLECGFSRFNQQIPCYGPFRFTAVAF